MLTGRVVRRELLSVASFRAVSGDQTCHGKKSGEAGCEKQGAATGPWCAVSHQSSQRGFIAQLAFDPPFLVWPPAKRGHDFVDAQRLVELFFGFGDTQQRLE